MIVEKLWFIFDRDWKRLSKKYFWKNIIYFFTITTFEWIFFFFFLVTLLHIPSKKTNYFWTLCHIYCIFFIIFYPVFAFFWWSISEYFLVNFLLHCLDSYEINFTNFNLCLYKFCLYKTAFYTIKTLNLPHFLFLTYSKICRLKNTVKTKAKGNIQFLFIFRKSFA